jgi:predicted nucleotidyltransferase
MSVLGFNEIYNNSTVARLQNNPPLDIKIPTLPGLVVLKLLSWNDNYQNRPQDAEDIFFILINYEYTGIEDKLYESELSLLEGEDFDNQVAGIVLLGKEMKMISSKKTIEFIRKILNNETSENTNYNLIRDISIGSNINFEKILFLIRKLKKGFDN